MAGSSSWRFAIPARTSERVLSEPDPRCQVVKVKVPVSVSKRPTLDPQVTGAIGQEWSFNGRPENGLTPATRAPNAHGRR